MPFSMISAMDVMGNISNRSAVKRPQSLGRCDKRVSSAHLQLFPSNEMRCYSTVVAWQFLWSYHLVLNSS